MSYIMRRVYELTRFVLEKWCSKAARSLHQDTLDIMKYDTLLLLSGNSFSPAISLLVQFSRNAPEANLMPLSAQLSHSPSRHCHMSLFLTGSPSACLPPSANPSVDLVGRTFNNVLCIRRKDQAPTPFSIPTAEFGRSNDDPKLSTVAGILMGLTCRPFILKLE
jgi:hypothetical protein